MISQKQFSGNLSVVLFSTWRYPSETGGTVQKDLASLADRFWVGVLVPAGCQPPTLVGRYP